MSPPFLQTFTALIAAGTLLAWLTLTPQALAAGSAKPNILFILVDNLGYGELGVYGGGATRGVRSRSWSARRRRESPFFAYVALTQPHLPTLPWPGKISAARLSDEIVHGVDLFPTLASFVGASVPKDRPIDGVDPPSASRPAPSPSVPGSDRVASVRSLTTSRGARLASA